MLGRKPVATELEKRALELKYQLRFRVVDAVSKAFDLLIPGIAAVLVAYFGVFRPVHDLAGRQQHHLALPSLQMLSQMK
jgi:hypothetical protein